MECEYHDICKRDSVQGNRCILHQDRLTKDGDQFAAALDEHLKAGRTDFRHMCFPEEVTFSENLAGERIDFRDTLFYRAVEFSSVRFDGPVDFTGAEAKKEVRFIGGEFRDALKLDRMRFQSMLVFKGLRLYGPLSLCRSSGGGLTIKEVEARGEIRIRSNFPRKVVVEETQVDEGIALSGSEVSGTLRIRDLFCGDNFLAPGSIFQGSVELRETEIEGAADFRNTSFGEPSYSSSGPAEFQQVQVHGFASFREAEFAEPTEFKQCKFHSDVRFTKARFEDLLFTSSEAGGQVDCTHTEFAGEANFSLSFLNTEELRCENLTFRNATFHEDALFAGGSNELETFEGSRVDFSRVKLMPRARVRFRYADLSRCEFMATDVGRIDFTGVSWCREVASGEWFPREGVYDEMHLQTYNDAVGPIWSSVERLYRQLKRSYQERGDYSRAGDFHIGEKEMRRQNPSTRPGMKALLWAYRAVSKYGERALPAVGCLAILILLCAIGYVVLGVSSPYGDYALEGSSLSHWGESLVISAKASLLFGVSPSFSHLGAEILRLIQAVASPPLLALLALALRQQVKR